MYDARGRRTAKNGITFTYDSNGNLIKQSNGLEFLYDHTGVFAVKYNNATYFYRKNAQQDIIALLDNTGATVVKYKYDAWGKCEVLNVSGVEITDDTHIGILNPFRYRSYYYDTETGFYFFKTRYYDPEIGRFMTIDDISYLDPESINGLNLYAYCGNSPVMGYDPNGTWDWGTFWGFLGSSISIGLGVLLCFVPGAQAFSVGLIVAGATSMASTILSASGFDSKTVSVITNSLSIIGGVALCFTPFASIGASMIGSGVLGIAGGCISEDLGGSFELGSAIGNIVGGFLGGQIYKGLVNHGVIPFKTSVKNVVENPMDDINKPNIGPKQGLVTDKIHQIQQTGRYEIVDVIKLPDGTYQAQDGHHNLRALISLGYKYIWVQFTK